MKSVITVYPNKELFEKTRDIPKDQITGDTYRQIGSSMLEILKQKGGVGLSANQVGLPLNMCVLWVDPNDKIILLNPRVVKHSMKLQESREGCLSLPGADVVINRHSWVEVEYEDVTGETHQERFSNFKSFVIQHEIDHLNGILMTNRLNEFHKNKALKAVHNFKKRRNGRTL